MTVPPPAPDGPLVLLVSSNGAGMGHITRLAAMARRRSPGVRALFASMSSAVPVVAEPLGPGSAAEGFGWEYIPSRDDLATGSRRWNVVFERRFRALLAAERPDVVVFDGIYPYEGLFPAAADAGVPLVWSRRGMWRAGLGARQLARSGEFALVVEPGDLAAEADPGLTAHRTDARRVGPVTLLDPDELLPREEAAAVLGVDPDRPVALVLLGTGTVADMDSALGRFTRRFLAEPDVQVVVTRPLIAEEAATTGDRVRGMSLYPVARYLAAVDMAVAAAGYNAFHELVQLGVPTAFLPKASTGMDDQLARARWARDAGAALLLEEASAGEVDRVVTVLADPARRAELSARCAAVARPNGARDAMAHVETLLGVAR